ncbi:hypothetical protein Bca52824_055656 [Brassica carinata]|uniref:GDSL esterase/lipase n=1 Tax=Brassica carinata TaxID=52824 RepID=A0A8X7UQ77_BRACI|nr:hypothetical protein Bca52824_055656 [Brassica carinata]
MHAAEGLGVKNIVPAYRSSDLQPNDILTGVSFASGGSGLDPMTAQVQGVIWIPDQLNDFKAYIAKLNSITGDEEKTRSIISNAVYVISAGNNDLGITFVSNPARNSRYTVFSYTNMMISWTQSFMQELYNLGARKFGIMGTLPLGCLPGASNAIGGICLEPANAVARLFNQKLANEVNNLNSVLPGSRSIYIDIFASGGSGLDPMTAQVQGVIWIPDQLNDFKAYIAKLNSITGDEEKTRSIISNAVYVISAGNNDLGITFVSNPARNSRYTVFSYTNMMISWTQSFMQVR